VPADSLSKKKTRPAFGPRLRLEVRKEVRPSRSRTPLHSTQPMWAAREWCVRFSWIRLSPSGGCPDPRATLLPAPLEPGLLCGSRHSRPTARQGTNVREEAGLCSPLQGEKPVEEYYGTRASRGTAWALRGWRRRASAARAGGRASPAGSRTDARGPQAASPTHSGKAHAMVETCPPARLSRSTAAAIHRASAEALGGLDLVSAKRRASRGAQAAMRTQRTEYCLSLHRAQADLLPTATPSTSRWTCPA
jgi:hypothetical protein